MTRTLAEIVQEKPFTEFADWWPVGANFTSFMSNAIYPEWHALAGNDGQHDAVIRYLAHYLKTVYGRDPRPGLLVDFIAGEGSEPLQSGEFDALSYAFYRAAFELIAAHPAAYEGSVAQERRLFTKRVGSRFFAQVETHLRLDLPAALKTPADLDQLKKAIDTVGNFLTREGYLRDHFAFTFDVQARQGDHEIKQTEGDLLANLAYRELAHALYVMGYPIILPSAVYLYNTIGEAQHHSSRTIEELFARVGLTARETDDFDPTGFPSDRVVELWEIRP